MRVLVALAVLVTLAPVATAQLPGLPPNLNVFVEDPGRALTPGAVENLTVVVNYQPPQGGRPTPAPTPDRPENVTPTRITLGVKQQPSWVTGVTFDPPVVLIDMGLERVGTSSFAKRVTASLTVASDAPALERESFIVTAAAEPNGNMGPATAESPDIKLRATTVGILNVTAEPTTVLPGGRWTVVPFTVRNDGNSDIVARVNVTVRPENSQVEFEETLELARNETKIVEVRLRTPWTNAEIGTLELEAVPIIDGEEGAASRAEVAVRGESAVPAPPLALLLLALAPFALARRR